MKKKLYIITPVSRIENLSKIFKSINWNYVTKWIIVYDKKIIKKNPYLFKNIPSVVELLNFTKNSIRGSGQRNTGIEYLLKEKKKNSFVYFLDDDNIIHPNFYNIYKKFKDENIYTFSQQVKIRHIRAGNKFKLYHIDTAMFVTSLTIIKNIRWKMKTHETDYHFIKECLSKNKNRYVCINNVGCYYNYLSDNLIKRNIKKFKTFVYNNLFKF
tara:strand:+ start:870 stop:1508 length:639 start_codon:yes stop_codon:yes gene_type:complete